MSIRAAKLSEAVSSTLFGDLLDDAAMFPPGSAAAPDALQRHREHRRTSHADHVGPLLFPANRAGDMATALRASPGPVRLVQAGAVEPPVVDLPGATIVGYEVVSKDGSVPESADRLAVEPATAEIVEDLLANLGEARIDGRPVIAKFRTGGLTADAFPSEDDLAYLLLAAYNAGTPFKLTAGLHHAIRHTADGTGFEHHGFLNVLAAVARCQRGAQEDDLAAVLAERDPGTIAGEVARLSLDDAVGVRAQFVSFGCCGVEEPIADLAELGLIGSGS